MIPLMHSSELRPAATQTANPAGTTNTSTSNGAGSGTSAANTGNTADSDNSGASSGFSELLGQMQPGNGGKALPLSGGNRLPFGQTNTAMDSSLLSNGQAAAGLENGLPLSNIATRLSATTTVALDAATADANAESATSMDAFPMASDLLQQIRQAFQPGKLAAGSAGMDSAGKDTDDETLTDDALTGENANSLAALSAVLPLTPPPAVPTNAATDSALPAMHDVRRFGDSPINGVDSAADGSASSTDNNRLDNSSLTSNITSNLADNAANDSGQSGAQNSNGSNSLDALDLTASNRTSTGSAFSTQLAQHSRVDTSQTSTAANSTTQDPLLNNRNDARLALDADTEAWGQQIGSRIMTLIGKDIQEARIHLDPPELGSLEIRMTVDSQDQTRIQIHAQHPQVRDVLEAQSNRLRDALAQQGLSLNEFNVSDQSQQQAGARSGNQGDNSGNGTGGSGQDTTAEAVELDADNPAVRVTQHQGLVSTYA